MKLSKTWTTVTPLSKAIALMLVIALPFIGFYFGYKFSQESKLQTPTQSTCTISELK